MSLNVGQNADWNAIANLRASDWRRNMLYLVDSCRRKLKTTQAEDIKSEHLQYKTTAALQLLEVMLQASVGNPKERAYLHCQETVRISHVKYRKVIYL